MSYIKQARTPTLIQHGELDRRVPIANAYELRQGLEDRGVPVEMVVYKGFGHGITKPKASARGDAAQPRLVQSLHLGRRQAGSRRAGAAESACGQEGDCSIAGEGASLSRVGFKTEGGIRL